MTAVVQSGNVTPGHLAAWVTTDTLGDGGPPIGQSETVLARLLGANFNSTGDQQIALPGTVTKVCLTRLIVTNASISLTTAAGGFYPQPGKAGTAIVANSQVYSALTDATKLLNPTLTAYGTGTLFTSSILTAFSLYFALTTPQGAPATADIYVCGIVLG